MKFYETEQLSESFEHLNLEQESENYSKQQ